MRKLIRKAALGAAVAYFMDPNDGARRRNAARDRVTSLFRQASAKGESAAGVAAAPDAPFADDNTLKDRIMSEAFRPADAPKGDVNVDVAEGVVTLRGELESDEAIETLRTAVEKVDGVREVKSLLHTPEATPENVEEVSSEDAGVSGSAS